LDIFKGAVALTTAWTCNEAYISPLTEEASESVQRSLSFPSFVAPWVMIWFVLGVAPYSIIPTMIYPVVVVPLLHLDQKGRWWSPKE